MKLLSIELTEETIQVAYTDGQSVDSATQMLTYRQPFDGDRHRTVAWNQLRVVSALADWANNEVRRLRNDIEKNH